MSDRNSWLLIEDILESCGKIFDYTEGKDSPQDCA